MSSGKGEAEPPRWEVIHISTGHEGGAGLAARRLNAALNSKNVNSRFVALEHPQYTPWVHEVALKRNIRQKLLGAIFAKTQSKLSLKTFFSIFSVNVLTVKKILKLSRTNQTVIHIHNWFNIINQRQITKFIKAGFPVVLTMHDQRIMTGGCHYSYECNGFEFSCRNCPLLPNRLKNLPHYMFKRFQKIFELIGSNFYLIAPSKWIYNQACKSSLMNTNLIKFVPNTLNLLPAPRYNSAGTKSRSQVLRVGIASMNKDSYIKGGDLIKELQDMNSNPGSPLEFLFLSSSHSQENPEDNFWKMIDVLLVPSRADNSPNVIHEAKAYAIPVMGSDVGGITELLSEDFDELIPIKNLNSKYLFERLANWQNRTRGLSSMQKQFLEYTNDSVQKHIEIYKDILNPNK